jgi:DNA-binding LacI/PurR family transcriptional regulator
VPARHSRSVVARLNGAMATGRRRPTINDVARAASVSVTTVSDAISGKGRVGPATRRRVLDAADAVGWQPRRAAQSLRSGRTGTIALCIPPSRDSWAHWMRNSDYFQQVTASCAAAAIDAELLLLLAPRPTSRAALANLDVDGLVLVDPLLDDPVTRLCNELGVPMVSIDRQPDSASSAWVGNDHAAGTTLALDHLASRGARSIALFTGAEPWGWFTDTRRAYDEWCANHGVAPVVRHIDLDLTIAAASSAFAGLAADGVAIDAVLALPTNSALGVLDAVAADGRRVPEAVRVIAGVDSVAVATAGVSALDLQPAVLAREAVTLLRERVAGRTGTAASGPTVVETLLRQRSST